MPLNGRNYLELAKLEPGVTVANVNARVDVTALGAARPAITIDGGKANNYADGTTRNKLSQEIVEEFQIATVNFDLSISGAAGTVNIVTRSGGNQFHGGGFYLFRDHNMAAYPALKRDPVNPDPFFRRWQGGLSTGGPLRRNRMFFFANFEHSHQDGVSSVQNPTPEFASLGGIFPLPVRAKQFSVRLDGQANARNNLFLRFSHDDVQQRISVANALPSSWTIVDAPTHQAVLSWTSARNPSLVNELHFSFNYWGQKVVPLSAPQCGGCFGYNSPFLSIFGAQFSLGRNSAAPSTQLQRTYEVRDTLSWQRGRHAMRFGVGWENEFPARSTPTAEPVSLVLYSPAAARAARLPLPSSFLTFDDFLALPLYSFQTGMGDPKAPPLFNFDRAKRWSLWRFYWQDTWRIHPRLTFNYGVAYSYDTFSLNHDLSKPIYLLSILGEDGLEPTRKNRHDIAPAAGFAWSVTGDNSTVIRGGAGLYYDQYLWLGSQERTTLAPRGQGRNLVDGSYVANPIPNITGVPVGRALDFRTQATAFTGAHLMTILPSVRAGLQRLLGDPHNTDLSVRNIEVFKQQNSTGGLFPRDHPDAYAEHFNVGIQRRLSEGLVLSADFAFRQFIHTDMGGIDLNHRDSVRGSVLPICIGDQRTEPKAACSTGPILVNIAGSRSHYKALLVKVDKRFSRRTQFQASYALSSNVGFNGTGNGFNKDNWFENFGPLDTDRRHILNVAGVIELPLRLTLSFLCSASSRAPFTAYLQNLDLNGDGTNGDVLPGTRVNQLNRGLAKSELNKLADLFNQQFAGTRTGRGQTIAKLALPDSFQLGDHYVTQDVRLSRSWHVAEHVKATLFAEAFNVFNIANLSGHSGNLQLTSNFGQPTTRASQVFGSGGPRAFQFGARISF
jgi:hypothetical protein